jgi:hypothetical protein
MLSAEQVERFKQDGVLVLRQFFTGDEVARWRAQVQEYFDEPQDGDAWRAALATHKADSF